MGIEGKISVSRNKMVVVAAALTSPPKQHHHLPLSNLDLLLPPEYFSIFLCYKNPLNEGNVHNTYSNVITLLKEALSVCLVSFCILAGEMSQNTDGEPHVLCNNLGVDFVEAFADVNLKDIDFYDAHKSVDGILIPEKKHGILGIQVTQLKCGGLVISCTFDHRVSDAYSANMFLLSWVEIAQSGSRSSCVPTFDRSRLSARKAPSFDHSVVNTFVPEPLSPSEDSHSNGMNLTHQAKNAISRIYYMKASDITKLQSLANISNNRGCDEFRKKTKLEAFSAFLWKLIASGEHSSEGKSCKMGIVVDGRGNLSSENDGKPWNLYFGNVLSIPFGEMEIAELKKKPINFVADSIQEFLKPAVRREHFLGLVDYVDAHRPKKLLAKIYTTKVNEDEAAVVISSGLRFPIGKMDLGWGLPVFGSSYFSWKGKSGYVMPIPSARGNGDWIVYMHLLERQFELIENCEDGILRRLTSDYLFKE